MVHFKGEYLSWFLCVDSTLWRRNDKYYVWELKWKIKIEKYLINAMCKAAKQALTTHQYPLYCISVNNMISWDLMRVYPYIYGIYLYLYMRWLVMYEIPSHFIHLAKICFNCNVTFEIRADESSATIKTQTSYNWRLRWRRMQFELDRGLQKTVFNWKNFSQQLVNNWVISRPLSVCFLFCTSEDSQSSRLD